MAPVPVDSMNLFDRRSALRILSGAGSASLLSCAMPGGATPTASNLRSDGRSEESRSLQAEVDRLAAAGGGELRLRSGGTTLARGAPVVGKNVSLDLNGGTLLLELSETNATGVRLRSGATLRNGRVIVRSSGRPSFQSGAHAPVVVGPLLGEGGTPDRVSPDGDVSGWTISDLVLSSDKDVDLGYGVRLGCAAIQIMGGAHNGLIENISIPDSNVMLGGVHMDWGVVGHISSEAIAASAAAFRRGDAYTTHPHDIVVRNIRIGRLTRPMGRYGPGGGTFGVRLSGSHNIHVSDVEIDAVTGIAFCHTAGDVGYEFAPAEFASLACRGVVFTRGFVHDATTAYLIGTDSYADNIGREVARGYRPMHDPIHTTDVIFDRIAGRALDPARANFGIRVDHQRGGRIVDCTARGFRRGFYIDEHVDGLTLIRPVALDSAEHGISVEHPSRPPRNVTIQDPTARGSGRIVGSPASGILIGRSENVELRGSDAPLDATQRTTVRITREARGVRVAGTLAGHVMRD